MLSCRVQPKWYTVKTSVEIDRSPKIDEMKVTISKTLRFLKRKLKDTNPQKWDAVDGDIIHLALQPCLRFREEPIKAFRLLEVILRRMNVSFQRFMFWMAGRTHFYCWVEKWHNNKKFGDLPGRHIFFMCWLTNKRVKLFGTYRTYSLPRWDAPTALFVQQHLGFLKSPKYDPKYGDIYKYQLDKIVKARLRRIGVPLNTCVRLVASVHSPECVGTDSLLIRHWVCAGTRSSLTAVPNRKGSGGAKEPYIPQEDSLEFQDERARSIRARQDEKTFHEFQLGYVA